MERPIIFNSEMVKAILEGRKTQTRRVIKPEWFRCLDFDEVEDIVKALAQCPYGKPGDLLWVRETWKPNYYVNGNPAYKADHHYTFSELTDGLKWHPSIFMPRIASRLTLEIKDIRVERLQNINEKDAWDEGIGGGELGVFDINGIVLFKSTWNNINAKRGYSWDSNPFVWVIEFNPLPANQAERVKTK